MRRCPLARLNEVIEREKEWLRGFMATAEMSDHSMGEMLRSYAISLLEQKVSDDLYPFKIDGKPMTSEHEEASILNFPINQENAVINVQQYLQSFQYTITMMVSIRGKIESADAPRLFSLIRRLQTQSLMEVYFNMGPASAPIP